MPPRVPQIRFDPTGPALGVEISFPTLQVVSYTLVLFETSSNAEVLRETGNNVNPGDDKYALPTPPQVNKGRLLQFDATFIDPGSKPNSQCRAEAAVKQGGSVCGVLTVVGTLTGASISGSSFGQLVPSGKDG